LKPWDLITLLIGDGCGMLLVWAAGLSWRDLCYLWSVGVQELIEKIRMFNREREWGKYHSPKNLVMALAGEVGELIEHFQWLTEEESRHLPATKKTAVEEEIGDVTICLLNLADQLGVDVLDAAGRKLERNKAKYPVDKARGRADKYTDLA
jgi:dCTP diphosphatase